ncbi:hypothetical protein MUP32_06250 [Candidatus Microgenomates bacterium]|nr:hypothetical protein [Candidatus Microgenomates bacterium]
MKRKMVKKKFPSPFSVLLILIALIAGLATIVVLVKKSSYPPLPTTDKINNYIQSQLVDLDKDGIKEMVAIYPEREDETSSYNTVFVIFKLKDNRWVKLIEQKLGNFLFTKDRGTLVEFGKIISKFTLSDLTNDGAPDVLAEGIIEGSGGYLYAYIYGLKNGQLEQLWFSEHITKGEVGIEDNKVWLIMPNYYGPSDPSCCPSEWVKRWWQRQGDSFKIVASVIEADAKGDGLKKLKAMPCPSGTATVPVAIDPNPPFLVYPGAVKASGQGSIPGEPGFLNVQAYAVKNTTLDQIKTWYKEQFANAFWHVQKTPGFAGDNDFTFQKGDSEKEWVWLQVLDRENWDTIAMRDKRDLAPDETGFRLFWH